MKILRTYGDSHSLHAWPKITVQGWQIETQHLGARLLHSFNTRPLAPVGDADVVCFCFGEIDCRVWSFEHGTKGLAQAYIQRVRHLCECPMVMGIVPPERDPRPVHNGDANFRRKAVVLLNLAIHRQCTLNGVRYLDVYQAYRDQEGFMRTDLVGKRGHIGDHRPLENLVRAALYDPTV